jgi:hypothetical protein
MNEFLEQTLFAFFAAGGAAAGIHGVSKAFFTTERRFDKKISSALRPSRPQLAQAASSVVALYDDVFRHADGGFTAGWRVDLAQTYYAADETVNALYARWLNLLNLPKPSGTIIQLRLSTVPEAGLTLAKHLETHPSEDGFPAARALHNLEIDFQIEECRNLKHRKVTASLFVRVPTKKGNRIFSRESVLMHALRQNLSRSGLKGLLQFQGDARESLHPIVQRYQEDEVSAFESASQVWRRIEEESPLPLRRLTAEEMWRSYFLSHNPSAKSVPSLKRGFQDIRGYQVDPMAWEENFVLHGDVPVAIVSLTKPPQGRITAGGPIGSSVGCMRLLAGNPNWTFPHTHVFEHITQDGETSKKNLRKREASLRASGNAAFQKVNTPPREAQAALAALDAVAYEVASGAANLADFRAYTIVYGEPCTTANRSQSEDLLRERCDAVEAAWRTVFGANAVRDKGAILRCTYENTLVGECDARRTGAEIQETNPGLAALFPLERGSEAKERHQLFFRSAQGCLTGFNLFDLERPTAAIIAPTGGGKSVFAGALVNAALATRKNVNVNIIDFGSFANYGAVVEAEWVRFNPMEPAGFNIWWNADVAEGRMPEINHINLVIADVMILAGLSDDDGLGRGIVRDLVQRIFETESAKNSPGCSDPSEPRLSHFLRLLQHTLERNRNGSEQTKTKMETLLLTLKAWANNPWLDAVMDPRYKRSSPLKIYDMQSLKNFAPEIQRSLGFRVAAQVLRSLGRNIGEERTPIINVLDELKRICDDFPDILKAGEIGAREGRKDNTFTLFLAQSYANLTGMPNILANLGAFILGLQNGESPELNFQAGLSEDASVAVRNLQNAPGRYAQFLISTGGGDQRRIQQIQFELSPTLRWTFTSHPPETDAINHVARLKPHWTRVQAIAYLAGVLPQGLRQLQLTSLPSAIIADLSAGSAR